MIIPSVNMNETIELNFENLVEDVSCIILEDTPEAFLLDCWKILKYTDLYYLYSLSDFAICIFDKEGQFIKRIDSKGKGAIETPCDIFISEKDNQLWVIDRNHFINKYTLKGEFIDQVELPFSAVKMARIDNDILFYNGGFDKEYSYYFRETTPVFTTTNSFITRTVNNYTAIPISLFADDQNKKEIYVLPPHNDTIYVYGKDKHFIPFLHLNFDGDLLTFNDYPKNGFTDRQMAEIINKKEKIYNITGFNFTAGLLFMNLKGKENSYRAIDIATKTVYKFDSLIDNIPFFSQTTIMQGSTEESILISLPAQSLIREYSIHNKQTKYESIKNLLDNISSKNNRVLVEIKVKNNL